MTHPDSSDDHQQPGVIHPALPRQADGPPPKAAAQLAASGLGFKIAAAFQAEQSQRLDGYPRWASGLPLFRADEGFQQAISKMAASPDLGLLKVIKMNQQAVSLAARVPKLNIVGHIFPAARADLGFQQAISKMAASPHLGLLKVIKMNQQAVSLAARVPKLNIVGHIFPAARADLGFQQAISKMAASPHLGLLKVNQQLIRSAAVAMAAPHYDLLRNIGNFATSITTLPIPVNFTGMGVTASLVDLFLRWREAAESGMGVLRGLARAAFRAALRARAAVLHGDDDGLVAWFIETWLGLRVSPERIEAVSAALLEEGWDASVPDDPAHLLTDLRRRTARQARFLRPIWETQLNHRTIGMLDQPVITGNGTLLAVADLIPGGQAAEDLVLAGEWEERRLLRVLSRLKPDELRVTNVYAQHSELTWAEAARISGATDPAAAGERVRRKLKRLGAEETRRLAPRSSLPVTCDRR